MSQVLVGTDAVAGSITLNQDTGDRFPLPPFTGLFFDAQSIPTEGVDAETVTVTTIDHDTVIFDRGPQPIVIASGKMLSALRTQTLYNIEDTVALAQEFPVGDTALQLSIRDPQGNISEPSLDTAGTPSAGGSTFTYSFQATKPGQWYYVFRSTEHHYSEQDFFVRYSEVSP
jgi:hypothetical protein